MSAILTPAGRWLAPKIDSSGPGARGGHTLTVVGTQVIMFGGSDRVPVTYDDLWVLDTGKGEQGLQWTRITPSFANECKVHPRSGATLTAVGDQVYLFGGQEPVTEFRFGDIKVLDTTCWTWSDVQVTGTSPPARHSHTATCLANQCVMVYGGSGYSGSLSDIWVFNPGQGAWTQPTLSGQAPPAREMHCAVMVTPTCMMVFGGRASDGSILCDAVLFEAGDMKWLTREMTPFTRASHCCAALRVGPAPAQGNQEEVPLSMIAYGGFSGEAVEGDVLKIDGKTLEVEVLHRGPRQSDSAGSVPPERFAAAAAGLPAWPCGPALCIFGGVNSEADLADTVLWCMDGCPVTA